MKGTQSMLGRLILLAILMSSACALLGQINRGTIEGLLTDPSDAIVPGGEVTVVSSETNVTITVRANTTGYYRAADLLPGKYKVTFQAPGFSRLELSDVEVSPGKVSRIDGRLRLDATQQSIQVVAETPLIDPSPVNVTTTVETTTIQTIPLAGRDIQQLTFLIPGVNNVTGPPGSNFGFNSAFGSFPDPTNAFGSNIAVNGGQGGANAWYLDGNLNLASFAENVVINPAPEAVVEFQSVTSGLSAEYGRTGGGVFSVVLRSGTNQFHGSLYEFFRSNATNARNPFNSIGEGGKIIQDRGLHFNNFGGTLGGPVVIPKIYNGKDKTFFFFSLDKTILHLLGQRTYSVPTARMRRGDFSEDMDIRNNGLWDPYSTVGPDAEGMFTRQPFLNPDGSYATKIPANRLDPTAMYFMKSFPMPNFHSPLSNCPMGLDGYAVCDNYLGTIASSQDPMKLSLKIDHQINERNHLFGEWLYSPVPYRNYRVPWSGATFPWSSVGHNSAYPFDLRSTILAIGDTYTIRPTLINEFRALFSRQFLTTFPSHPYPDSTSDQSAVQQQLAAAKIPSDPFFPIPQFEIWGSAGAYYTFGPQAWVNMNSASDAYTILDNITYIRGKHTLKAGFTYRLDHTAFETGFPTIFRFRGWHTTNPVEWTGGSGLAQFMLGAVSDDGRDSSTGVFWTPYERFRYWGFFLQDDFRIARNFTMNIGLRYDINGSFRVRTGNMTNFCLDCMNELTGMKGKIVFEGDPEFPKGDVRPANKNSFAPRINFAWSPGGNRKTVIRTGYDIFYSNAFTAINGPGQGAANAPGWTQEFDWNGSFYPDQCASHTGRCVAFPLSDTTTDKNALTTPARSAGFPAARRDPLLGGFIQFFTPPSRDPMVQSWNFEVQRELPGNMMASVAYVGSHGTHLVGEMFRQFNYLHTQDYLKYRTASWATVPITDYYSGKPAEALQQIYGTSELPRSMLLQDYPAFGGIQNNYAFDGTSVYHGMNVSVQKRLSHGFNFLSAYTYSKKITNAQAANMSTGLVDPIHASRSGYIGGRLGSSGGIFGDLYQDPDNKNLDRAIAADDITHMLNIAGTWELPVGKGKALLNRGGLVNGLLGGWRLGSNFNLSSGIPLRIECPSNEVSKHCDVVGPIEYGKGSKEQRIKQWMNPSAFAPPFGMDENFWANYDPQDDRAWRYGTAGLRMTGLRAPGFWNIDTSLSKEFHFTEQRYLEFRWDVYNTLNHQNLALPNNSWCLPPGPNGETDSVRSWNCEYGRIYDVQTDPRTMQFGLKLHF